jgi:hypothetical protein
MLIFLTFLLHFFTYSQLRKAEFDTFSEFLCRKSATVPVEHVRSVPITFVLARVSDPDLHWSPVDLVLQDQERDPEALKLAKRCFFVFTLCTKCFQAFYDLELLTAKFSFF